MNKIIKRGLSIAFILSITIALFVTTAFASEVKPIDGLTLSDTQNNIRNDNGTITATASGFLSKKTNKVTITNSGSKKANISFTFAITGDIDSCTDPWGGNTKSGEYSGILEPGGSVTISVTNPRAVGTKTATLEIKGITYQKLGDAVTATLLYDNAKGSVTVADIAKNNGDSFEIGEAGVAVAAAAKSGYEFVAWINADTDDVLSTKASDTLMPVTDLANVKAVFEAKSGQAWYLAGGNKLYNDFNAAVTYAASQTSKTVVLANNATMAAGTYTVTSGVTFLVPFDEANTLYTTAPAHDNHAGFVTPTAYRTLTMAADANIVVKSGGAVSLSAKHHSGSPGQTAGAPTGPCSFVDMNAGSSITVENGGSLYAWGYITGSGDVSVNNGGYVYEYFQFNDFRGGSHSSWALVMGGKNKGIFPVNSYFIQNIHANLKLNAGAIEKCYTTVYANETSNSTIFTFIAGSGAMFNITNGHLVKRYDVKTDRLIVDLYGDITISSMAMTLMGNDMDSTNYNLPINSNITVNINNGSDVIVGQHLALLPSSEINIAEGATMTVASGKRIIVYDLVDWKGDYNYPKGNKFNTLAYVPGRANVDKLTDAKLEDASICVNGTLTATAGYIYTTSGGANIYSTGTGKVVMTAGSDTETLQVTALATTGGLGAATTEDVTVTPAKLRNEAGTYLSTDSASSTTYNHDHYTCDCGDTATHGTWYAGTHTYGAGVVTAPTCTEQGYTTYTCACKHSYTDNEVAESGHDWKEEWSTNSTNHWRDCQKCDAQNDVGTHSNDGLDCNCDVCTYTMLHHSTNVELGNNLNMYFAFWKEDASFVWDNYFADITCGGVTQTLRAQDWLNTTITLENDTQQSAKVVYFDGLAAKQMSDIVTITLYQVQDGNKVNQITWTDSIRDYAMRLLEKHPNNTTLRTLLVDMLNYGAACQEKFGNTSNGLANALLTDTQKAYATQDSALAGDVVCEPENVGGYSANLITTSNIQFAVSFNTTVPWHHISYSFVNHWRDEDADGSYALKGVPTKGQLLDYQAQTGPDGTPYYVIPLLVVADAREAITISLMDADGNIVTDENGKELTWTDSILSYCKRMMEKTADEKIKAVCDTFIRFSYSAEQYLEGEDRLDKTVS